MPEISDDFSRRLPTLAFKFRRRNFDAEFLLDDQDELNGSHRVENLTLIKRQIEISEHLICFSHRSEQLQDFVREICSYHGRGAALSYCRLNEEKIIICQPCGGRP